MYLIKDAHIVNEGRVFKASVLIKDDKIDSIFKADVPESIIQSAELIDASDCWLMPGVIDDHVHFRDPGFPEKADFYSETCAAIAGGVTSVMDMPNTNPQTTSIHNWEDKMNIASDKSLCNYALYLGATNDNLSDLLQADPTKVCGIKLFLGSSTGNMLVEKKDAIENIFAKSPLLIAVHAEDEEIIQKNRLHFTNLYADKIPIEFHTSIRSAEACFKASAMAIELAHKYNSRLHLAHISTEKELALFENKSIDKKRISSEVCVNYLWFSYKDYEKYGAKIKCNPSIKTETDKCALLNALSSDKIDVIATDHAPHLLSEKNGYCMQAVSGIPSVQFSLPLMMEFVKRGNISIEQLVTKMCHNPAKIFNIEKRGFIRKGYKADLTIVRRKELWRADQSCVLSKCAWSPYEGVEFTTKVAYTFVNGRKVFDNGKISNTLRGEALCFNA